MIDAYIVDFSVSHRRKPRQEIQRDIRVSSPQSVRQFGVMPGCALGRLRRRLGIENGALCVVSHRWKAASNGHGVGGSELVIGVNALKFGDVVLAKRLNRLK